MVSNEGDEWFATGDLGSIDADGWLTLTGRSKEIINRGGEVVGPLEVEDACLRHPAVAECVCFAVPHEALGEALGLCIVPHATTVAPSLDELRQFLEPYLTAIKRPQHVWYMTQLIKGPTGKPLRVGLADKLGIAKQGGETGGGIAASASAVDAVIEAVRRVTGIKATSGAARVSDLGMDSLSLMRLSHALRGLGGSSEVDKLLLADATIDTLAVAVARPAAAAAEKTIDLDPVFGLRSLFCLFVVRAHFARHFAALCDTWWYDIHHAWHTSIFFIISGAQMFMTYSERPVATKTLLKNFFVSMAPMYYFTMAVGAAVSCPWFGPASYVWAALVAFYPFPAGSAMGPAWYHTCQFWNVLLFNRIRWHIRWQRLCACCGGAPADEECCDCCVGPCLLNCCAIGWSRPIPDEPDAGEKCCARKTSVKKPIPPPKSLGEFARRLVAPGLLAAFLNFFWHPFPPFRAMQFALGMVIGQGCLSVELNEAERKKVGRGTDAIFFIFMVLKFSPHEIVAWVQYGIHSVPEALLVFGLCRTPSESWTAKLLTHPLFLGFVPYTFAAYIIHFPVLLFAQFVRIEGITSLKELFRRVYRHDECYESDWVWRARGDYETEDDEAAAIYAALDDDPAAGEHCFLPWESHTTLTCVVIVAAILMQHLVHEPGVRLLHRAFDAYGHYRERKQEDDKSEGEDEEDDSDEKPPQKKQ